MSAFTLEIVRRGETPTVADVVTLPNGRVIWRQVEALALLIESAENTFIQVKNEKGGNGHSRGRKDRSRFHPPMLLHELSSQKSARETLRGRSRPGER